jgi:deoxyhypusine synthase
LTSNLVSSGLRETFRYIAEHKMIDCITTTAGAIEEDLMKSLSSSHLMGDFYLLGKDLKNAGIRRQGNIVIEDSKYESLWNFVLPLFK